MHATLSDGWVIPCVYSLLPGKTQSLYTALFEQLDQIRSFTPQSILMDYEIAMRNAVGAVWPGAVKRGCFFNYKQAMNKKVAMFDLKTEYETLGSDIRRAIKMLRTLPFVPEGDVRDAYDLIKPMFTPDLGEILEYFEGTWVGSSTTAPRYCVAEWNQHDTLLAQLQKSCNDVEGWHNGFSRVVAVKNPLFGHS